ncbi:hypothetical protein C2845_PM15G22270 [Panicum miliaceum]|uniref:Uncharacterized protein n=1 Tax=Panicum miliaceum TaxID=4540 RepID=A0A3L6Q5M8_PANMI|nr:hypothetical protein C2845_PM15G22270 [Panicum miliaceum]
MVSSCYGQFKVHLSHFFVVVDLQFVMAKPIHVQSPLDIITPHPTVVSNPEDDQSMFDLSWKLSHPHPSLGNPGDQLMDSSLPPRGPRETDPSVDLDDDFDWEAMLNELASPPEIRLDGVPSPGLAADAAAGAEIGQPTPGGSLGGDSFLPSAGAPHVAEAAPNVRAGGALLPGSLREPELFRRTSRRSQKYELLPKTGTSASSSATGPDLKSADGFIQPETGLMGYLARDKIDGKLMVQKMVALGKVILSAISDRKDHGFVHPQEPPTSKQRYITRFVAKLDDGDKKAGYWKEKEAKAIRDESASSNIIGLKRTLEYMNGCKRTHFVADEYVALEPCGEGALQIREEIAVRIIHEERKGTAPPSKCSKTGAHSSGESYIWQHMTRIYVKGEDGSTAAPSLLYGICHECDKAIKCPPNYGNGNLNKHLARVHDIHPPCNCKNQCVMAEEKGVVGRRAAGV